MDKVALYFLLFMYGIAAFGMSQELSHVSLGQRIVISVFWPVPVIVETAKELRDD